MENKTQISNLLKKLLIEYSIKEMAGNDIFPYMKFPDDLDKISESNISNIYSENFLFNTPPSTEVMMKLAEEIKASKLQELSTITKGLIRNAGVNSINSIKSIDKLLENNYSLFKSYSIEKYALKNYLKKSFSEDDYQKLEKKYFKGFEEEIEKKRKPTPVFCLMLEISEIQILEKGQISSVNIESDMGKFFWIWKLISSSEKNKELFNIEELRVQLSEDKTQVSLLFIKPQQPDLINQVVNDFMENLKMTFEKHAMINSKEKLQEYLDNLIIKLCLDFKLKHKETCSSKKKI